jgi:hypothetical protein
MSTHKTYREWLDYREKHFGLRWGKQLQQHRQRLAAKHEAATAELYREVNEKLRGVLGFELTPPAVEKDFDRERLRGRLRHIANCVAAAMEVVENDQRWMNDL